MRKILFISALVFALVGCNRSVCIVEGDITGAKGTVEIVDEQQQPIGSAEIVDGKFEYRFEKDTMMTAYLTLDKKPFAMLFLEPGTIKVKGDASSLNKVKVSGTPSNDAIDEFRKVQAAFMAKYAGQIRVEDAANINSEYDAMIRKGMLDNIDNMLGAILFANQYAAIAEYSDMLKTAEMMPEKIRKMSIVEEALTRAESKYKVREGYPYINIEQPDLDGNFRSLESVVTNPDNRYVLVDFWASWCHPCMEEIPNLKKMYADFHSKGFDIFGVSFDKSPQAWGMAVESMGMEWTQVSFCKGFDNPAAVTYGVDSIPATFLIDTKTGNIVANGLRGEELYAKVKSLIEEAPQGEQQEAR